MPTSRAGFGALAVGLSGDGAMDIITSRRNGIDIF